jgi:CheY-like chemotaxis protein
MKAASPPGNGVLLVEDDAIVRDAAMNVLEESGFQVVSAHHGLDALDLLRAGLRPALILLDWMMPVMNGAETLAAIQQDVALSTIPLVVFSAAPPDKLPGVRIVKKPLRMGDLLALVGEYCAPR